MVLWQLVPLVVGVVVLVIGLALLAVVVWRLESRYRRRGPPRG